MDDMSKFKEWLASLEKQPERIEMVYNLTVQTLIGSAKMEGEILTALQQFEADHPDVKVLTERNSLTGAAYSAIREFDSPKR